MSSQLNAFNVPKKAKRWSRHIHSSQTPICPVTEKEMSDFTLYFLAFNHSGRDLSDEEKEASRFGREGQPPHPPI